MNPRVVAINRLRAEQPRRPFVAASLIALVLLMAIAWTIGDFSSGEMISDTGFSNAKRFLGELRPWPVQQLPDSASLTVRWETTATWFADRWRARGAEAVATTLSISVVAIIIAGGIGLFLSLFGARNLAVARPFLTSGKRPSRGLRALWALVYGFARAFLTVVRALPEYIWAFILLALLGPTVWPMIFALALHNAGILGKLNSEVIENVDPHTPRALRALGASRAGILSTYLLPVLTPRFLLYFFYRWESCVRESTVLGMLGIASLGFWIVDARARNHYDDMIFYVLCGVILVVLGDLISALVRDRLRRA